MFTKLKTSIIPIIIAALLTVISCGSIKESRQLVVTTNINDGRGPQERPGIWLLGPRSAELITCNEILTYSLLFKRPNVFVIVNDFSEAIGSFELTEAYILITLEDQMFTFKIKEDYVSSR